PLPLRDIADLHAGGVKCLVGCEGGIGEKRIEREDGQEVVLHNGFLRDGPPGSSVESAWSARPDDWEEFAGGGAILARRTTDFASAVPASLCDGRYSYSPTECRGPCP